MEACEAAGFAAKVISSAESTADQVVVLQITGMTCGSCSAAVENALRAEPGVTTCSVNLLANKAEVPPVQQQFKMSSDVFARVLYGQ